MGKLKEVYLEYLENRSAVESKVNDVEIEVIQSQEMYNRCIEEGIACEYGICSECTYGGWKNEE